MAGRYHAQAARARATLSKKGGVGVLTRVTDTHDPVAQTKTSSTTTHSFVAIAEKESRARARAQSVLGANAVITQKIALLLASALDIPAEPTAADRVRWAGADWSVLHAEPLDPAGDEVILWSILVQN